jgi:predicted transcriptional regulator
MNKALYVRLDDETWAALQKLAELERRQAADQAAISLREQLLRAERKLQTTAR